MAGFGFPRISRTWVATLPLPAYFGVVTVLYGVLTWGFNAIQHPRDATWADLLLRIVTGSLYGAVMTGVIALQRRRFGGSALMGATANAIRAGQVPADADPKTWTPIVERRLHVMRRSRWLSPLLMAPIVAFGVLVWILVPGAAGSAVWLIGLSIAVVAFAEVQVARFVPRTTAVLEQLRLGDRRPVETVLPPPEEAARPWSVLVALIACGVAAAGVAVEVCEFLAMPRGVAAAARSVSTDSGISLARADHLAMIAVTVLATYWVVLLIALAVLGWSAFRGRNWARALLVPTALLTLLEAVAHKPISITVTVAAVAAIVLLYLPASNAYFATRKARRNRRPR